MGGTWERKARNTQTTQIQSKIQEHHCEHVQLKEYNLSEHFPVLYFSHPEQYLIDIAGQLMHKHQNQTLTMVCP